MTRGEMIERVQERVRAIADGRPVLVGIDGVDGAGKSRFADELAGFLEAEMTVCRASVDGFHNPRAVRYQRGALSPAGYYEDSFNTALVIESLLRPLSLARGDARVQPGPVPIRRAAFDHRRDRPVEAEWELVPHDCLLLFDGIFANRPKFREFWDLTIFLHCDFSESIRRSVARDCKSGESKQEMVRRFHERYVPAQIDYLTEHRPLLSADLVIDNTRLHAPRIVEHPEDRETLQLAALSYRAD
jgi:uridine kinase